MLALIAAILVILWLLGFAVLHVGSLIHIVIIVAIIVFIVHLVRGRA